MPEQEAQKPTRVAVLTCTVTGRESFLADAKLSVQMQLGIDAQHFIDTSPAGSPRGAAMQRLLEQAHVAEFPFFAVLDDDNLFASRVALSLLASEIGRHCFVTSGYVLQNISGGPMRPGWRSGLDFSLVALQSKNVLHGLTLFNTQMAVDAGGFDETLPLCPEYKLARTLWELHFNNAPPLLHVDDELLIRRVHPDQVSVTRSKEQVDCALHAAGVAANPAASDAQTSAASPAPSPHPAS